ncbi:MAG: alpha-amylase family glycosyl hydrolase [Cyclobacteriaceae bacterium]|jgi:glycosidase
MIRSFFFSLLVLASLTAVAQTLQSYPPHWWAGMKTNRIEVMLHGKGIGSLPVDPVINYPGVVLEKVERAQNANYLYLTLRLAEEVKPGKAQIVWNMKKGPRPLDFEIKARRPDRGTAFAQGVSSSDFIYLIMPDRFSNGDAANDRVAGMRDQSLHRDSLFHRHGGDIQGIINHLDYLQELGVTALWLMPVLENDVAERSEHGYNITNHYRVDSRLGGEVAYKKLSDALHQRGMKLIQDAVYNHVGSTHFFITDKPDAEWVHNWPRYTNTTYKDNVLYDPYGAESDKRKMSDGWFTPKMPDLNQSNPHVANFLIQNAIWSVEEFGVDAWRIDTYLYNDLEFMNRCNQALLNEYPSLHLFGETWIHGITGQTYFTKNKLNVPFKSNLPGVTDFQTNLYGIVPALTQPYGWTEGVNRLYQTLAQDVGYDDPTRLVIFLDNHDLSRIYSIVGEDIEKQKAAIGWLLTCRGIPQLYYGTEILMKGFTNPDGWVRLDFKGGWPGDAQNKFVASGRTPQEEEVYQYTRTLANFRKSSSALTTGKLMQFQPDDALYVYFRYDDQQTVMCIMNTNASEKTIDVARYAERLGGFSQGRNVHTGGRTALSQNFTVPGNRMVILELER